MQESILINKRSLPQKNILEFLEQNKPDLFNEYSHTAVRDILEEISERREKLPKEKEQVSQLSDVEIRTHMREVDLIQNARNIVKQYEEQRAKALQDVLDGKGQLVAESTQEKPKDKKEKMNELELRSFQKYITQGMKNLTEEEQRALTVSGAAAVIPTEITSTLITSEKYSNLLYRATQFNEQGAGKLYVPIASNTAASWKTENVDTGYEAAPTLTKLELGGRELYRLMRMSAASNSLSSPQFTNMMLNLLGAEVIETLEDAFVSGGGVTEPKGLDALTYDASNRILTASAATPIAASHVAEAMSLLPAKYAMNAIVMCNAKTLFNISQFKGTAEYAFSLSDGATKFLGKEIVLNEHMSDNVIYILDPKELYVRWASPLAIEADRSSGFTAAAIDLRALTVVDFAWNPKAVVKVGLGA